MSLRLVLTDDAALVLEVRSGRRRVAQVKRNAKAGRTTLSVRAPKRGRYTLVLTATGAGRRVATDQARLTVR
jgi:hypothetical protein